MAGFFMSIISSLPRVLASLLLKTFDNLLKQIDLIADKAIKSRLRLVLDVTGGSYVALG